MTTRAGAFACAWLLATGVRADVGRGPSIFSTASGDLIINSSTAHPDSQVLVNGADLAGISDRADLLASIVVAATGGSLVVDSASIPGSRVFVNGVDVQHLEARVARIEAEVGGRVARLEGENAALVAGLHLCRNPPTAAPTTAAPTPDPTSAPTPAPSVSPSSSPTMWAPSNGIPNGAWVAWPNGGNEGGAFNNNMYMGGYTRVFGSDGSTMIRGTEHPMFYREPVRTNPQQSAAFSLYGWGGDGSAFTMSCHNAFQMGIFWGSDSLLVTDLRNDLTLEATCPRNAWPLSGSATGIREDGMGVYLGVQGVGNRQQFHFYNGASCSNNCEAGTWSRDKANLPINQRWLSNQSLTMTVGADDDSDVSNRRKIKVWLGDSLIYTFNQMVPAGRGSLWTYIGKGYHNPEPSEGPWNAAIPKFRYASHWP